jgi:hypothetical protein
MGKNESRRHLYTYLEINDKDEWKFFSYFRLECRREEPKDRRDFSG